MSTEAEMSLAEIIDLGAEDMLFFGRVFFPRTFKTLSPEFHSEVAAALDGPGNVQMALFRGAAKTSLTRVVCAKKLSYGETTLTLVVGKGQDHAIKTILWLKNHIENNTKWTSTFKLSKAINKDTGRPKKWSDEWITVYNELLDKEVHFVAYGIMGQIRGMNLDDCRPDFIMCDDILDDENSATEEQREKLKERFLGALMKSLTRTEENPMAKCALLQTPIDIDDLSMSLRKLKSWTTLVFSCFDANGDSRWEAQFSAKELRQEKLDFIELNKLSVWMREMEVTPISAEMRLMRPEWLVLYETYPEDCYFILTVDPTPPPKDGTGQKNKKLDDAVVMITAFSPSKRKFYVAEYYQTKSPQVVELVSKVFEFYIKYRPLYVGVETHLFQRTVKTSIEAEMAVKGLFFVIVGIEDKRNKFVRIKDTLQGLASAGRICVRENMLDLITQFNGYPQVKHDDLLDALSLATMLIHPSMLAVGHTFEGDFEDITADESGYSSLGYGGCP